MNEDRQPTVDGKLIKHPSRHNTGFHNELKFHLAETEDGEWIHWSSYTTVDDGHQQSIRQRGNELNLEAAPGLVDVHLMAENLRNEVAQVDDPKNEAEARDLELLDENPGRISEDLADEWCDASIVAVEVAVSDGLAGVTSEYAWAGVDHAWEYEAEHVANKHGLETDLARDLLQEALRSGVERKHIDTNAEYIAEIKLED